MIDQITAKDQHLSDVWRDYRLTFELDDQIEYGDGDVQALRAKLDEAEHRIAKHGAETIKRLGLQEGDTVRLHDGTCWIMHFDPHTIHRVVLSDPATDKWRYAPAAAIVERIDDTPFDLEFDLEDTLEQLVENGKLMLKARDERSMRGRASSDINQLHTQRRNLVHALRDYFRPLSPPPDAALKELRQLGRQELGLESQFCLGVKLSAFLTNAEQFYEQMATVKARRTLLQAQLDAHGIAYPV